MRSCMLILILIPFLAAGCSELKADVSPEPHPFAVTQPIEAILARSAVASESADAKLAELNAKVDRTNDLLQSLVDSTKTATGQQCDLLDEIKAMKAAPPVSPEPPKASALMEKEVTDPNAEEGTIRTNDGKQWFLSDFIGQYYRRPWSHPGTIDDHLADVHRVNLTDEFSTGLKEKLHAALHEYESGTRAKPASTPKASAIVQDCPDGQCPIRSKSVTVTTPEGTRSRSSAVYSTPPSTVTQTYQQPNRYYQWSYSSSGRCRNGRCRR